MKVKILLALFLLGSLQAVSCTVYKITKDGKTFVGNNEDHWDANSRLWFEKGKNGEYGAMFVGFDNLFAQGGMNEKGLVFDGFAVQRREVKKKSGKLQFYGNLFKDAMKKCQNTNEVYVMLQKYDLSPLNGGMLLFVEKSGQYLVVEADSMIIGKDDNYLLSNFCPSKGEDVRALDIPYYQKGRKLMEQKIDTSLSYLTSLSDAMHQTFEGGMGGTVFTTIYNLNEGTVNLYFYHDFNVSFKFNLKDELNKTDTVLVIPRMFPANTEGQDHFKKFNNAKETLHLLVNSDLAKDSLQLFRRIEEEQLYPMMRFFEDDLNNIGYEFLYKRKTAAAINVFKLNVKCSPRSWNCYDSLADGYMKAKEYSLALLNYKKSVEMNPENEHGFEQIRKIEKRGRR